MTVQLEFTTNNIPLRREQAPHWGAALGRRIGAQYLGNSLDRRALRFVKPRGQKTDLAAVLI
jgi:hypothetical protein